MLWTHVVVYADVTTLQLAPKVFNILSMEFIAVSLCDISTFLMLYCDVIVSITNSAVGLVSIRYYSCTIAYIVIYYLAQCFTVDRWLGLNPPPKISVKKPHEVCT